MADSVVELEQLGNRVKLMLGHGEGVELGAHDDSQVTVRSVENQDEAFAVYTP